MTITRRFSFLIPLLLLLHGCSSSYSVPMDYYYGSPWAESYVNGVPGYFLIDTGASITVLDTEMAQRSGVSVLEPLIVSATTGDVQLGSGRAATIELAGRLHTDRLVSIQDMASFHAPGGRRQSGLIGSDFLMDYNVILEPRDASIKLSKDPAPTARNMRPHTLEFDGGLPTVEVFFNGDSAPYWAILDSGSGYASERFVYLDISENLARSLYGEILNRTEPVETAVVINPAGRYELPIYEVGPVRILGRRFDTVRLVVHNHGEGAFKNGGKILIGGSILNQFSRMELDYPRRMVWVKE